MASLSLAENQQNELLFVGFNQDFGRFAGGTDSGFRIFNIEPFKETFRRFTGGGIGIVEMLYRCNLLALSAAAAPSLPAEQGARIAPPRARGRRPTPSVPPHSPHPLPFSPAPPISRSSLLSHTRARARAQSLTARAPSAFSPAVRR